MTTTPSSSRQGQFAGQSVSASTAFEDREATPLLVPRVHHYGTHLDGSGGSRNNGADGSGGKSDLAAEAILANEALNNLVRRNLNDEKRSLGLTSTTFLIFNRMIGTGIFATPSSILRSSGSVGLSLVMWLLGAFVAACGTAVYIELGTGIPRSGGEKNYLDFIYRRPKLLATCVYAMYAMFNGWQAAGCSVFGEYALHAIHPSPTPSPAASRFLSLLCITFAFLLHGTQLKWGIRLQNLLAVFKLLILTGMALIGLLVIAKAPGFRLKHPPRNFEWETMWKGSFSGGANAFVNGLYTVIWSFIGYSNANYALSEVRDPIRTIKRAAPLAVFSITIIYLLVNVAYYAVVDKDEILKSGRIAAALFFGKLWGMRFERVLSGVVALSTLGNVLAVLFSHGRVIQELGREGILPFSWFFASNEPFNAPLPGLFAQWLMTSLMVISVPPGDAYIFMLNLSSYPYALINMFVSGGLLLLRTRLLKYEWHPPFRSFIVVVFLFFLSNVFLVFAPLIPPAHGIGPYVRLPYFLHVLVSSSISLLGLTYWYVWYKYLPRRGGYQLVREKIVEEDGSVRKVVKKFPRAVGNVPVVLPYFDEEYEE
ncbi:amino acid permease-domain-containing protein [Abortiporus biennis]|nr:amino acid permease-domain-containing protein [Abortiporus biennis]